LLLIILIQTIAKLSQYKIKIITLVFFDNKKSKFAELHSVLKRIIGDVSHFYIKLHFLNRPEVTTKYYSSSDSKNL